MLAAITVAAMLVSDASVTASPAPLREIVFRAEYARRSNHVQEVFGGNRPDPYGSSIQVDSDNGTITVDIMAVADDGIATRVTELYNSAPHPRTTFVIISPDGTLRYDGDLSDAAVALLPYFGRQFAPDPQLAVGVGWNRQLSGPHVDIVTKYRVVGAEGPAVTVNQDRSIKSRTASGADATVSGSVVYKPTVLCPLSGDLTERTSSVGLDYNEDITLTLHFWRVLDTYDPAKQ